MGSEKEELLASENTLKLLTHLFHEAFLPAEQISEQERYGVLPYYFVSWVNTHLTTINLYELCNKVGVPVAHWDKFVELVNDPIAPERLAPMWPTIVIGNRDKPRVRLNAVNLVLLMHFEDGTIAPVTIFADTTMIRDAQGESPGFTDGVLCNFLVKQSRQLVNLIMQQGVDAAYRAGADFGGRQPFDVLMGAMLKITPQLKPEFRDYIKRYVRMIQNILHPELPTEAREALHREMRKANPPDTMLPTPRQIPGGFDG